MQFDDHGFVLLGADLLKLSNFSEFFHHSVFWVMNDPTQEHDIYYRPFQNVMYSLCQSLSFKDPFAFHLLGLSLHAAVVLALFTLLKELQFKNEVAFLAAAIYAVHPVLVQAVAWIAGVGDQLSALFSILSVIYFLRYVSCGFILRPLIMHWVFFLLAIFSKEISIMVIPVCMYLLIFKPVIGIRSQNIDWKKAWMVIPGWLILAAIFFYMRSGAISSTSGNLISSAIGSMAANGKLIFEYFEKIILPYRLSPIPSREDAEVIPGMVIVVSIVLLFIVKKWINSTLVFGLIWFGIFLLPTFIQQNPESHFFAFEHRLYLPLIGLIFIAADRLTAINIEHNVSKAILISVIMVCSAITFTHSRTFTEPNRFYESALSASPGSVIAWNGYGKYLLTENKFEEAVKAFEQSHKFKSDDIQTTGKIADILSRNLNRPNDAAVWFKKSLQIDPHSIEAAVSLADVYLNGLKDTSAAIPAYEHALQIDPDNEFAHSALGVILISKGMHDQGQDHLLASLKVNSSNLQSIKWMAISFFSQSEIGKAINYLNKGIERYPDDPDLLRNLAICHYKIQDTANTKKYVELCKSHQVQLPAELIFPKP